MIIMPQYVETTIEKIESYGYEAFLVGGCLRDIMLGEKPNDFDITTNAHPDKIEEIFCQYKTVNIGKEFGTIIVIQDEGNIEITTYRTESDYKDGRRPSEVLFSDNILEDLSRRDFTMNSLAYNKKSGIVDPFNGREDINNKIVRTVGNPTERFKEDHLRILRGIRFSTQLDFRIEDNTFGAMVDHGGSIKNISTERVYNELVKILLSEIPSRGIKLMLYTDILNCIIPELISSVDFDQKTPHHNKDVFKHSLCVLDSVPPILSLRFAALLHDIAKPHTFTLDGENIGHFYGHDKASGHMAKDILTRLRAPNHIIETVLLIINDHMSHHNDIKEKGLKRLIGRVGIDNIFNLLELQKADRLCSADKDIEYLLERERSIRSILEFEEPYEKSQIVIDGNDITELGYKQGKIVGEILEYALDIVIENPELNQYSILKEIIMKKFPI